MSDNFQDSWDKFMGNKPTRPNGLWLLVGMPLGLSLQFGPSAIAGFLGMSAWYAVGWGGVVAFYSTIVKSRIGRGLIFGSMPPHWLSAILIVFPLSFAIFATINFFVFWIVNWLFN